MQADTWIREDLLPARAFCQQVSPGARAVGQSVPGGAERRGEQSGAAGGAAGALAAAGQGEEFARNARTQHPLQSLRVLLEGRLRPHSWDPGTTRSALSGFIHAGLPNFSFSPLAKCCLIAALPHRRVPAVTKEPRRGSPRSVPRPSALDV